MTHFVQYPLAETGILHHWLACGPITTPLTALAKSVPPDGAAFGRGKRWVINYWAFDSESAALKQRVYKKLPRFTWKPTQQPYPESEGIAGQSWRYAKAEEDGVIDFSLFNFVPALMQGWLFACLDAAAVQTVNAELITIGPARVWLNGALVTHFASHFSYVAVQRIPITLTLIAGHNELYLQGDMLGWREARLALGLRLPTRADIQPSLPIGTYDREAWRQAERGLDAIGVKQFAFPTLPGYLNLVPDAAPFDAEIEVAMPTPDKFGGAVPPEQLPAVTRRMILRPDVAIELPITPAITAAMASVPGENTLSLRVRPANGLPLMLHRELWASDSRFSHAPYGTYEERRREAMEHLAAMPYDVLTSMAAVMLGKRKTISSEAVALACHFMDNRFDCADFYAIGLLALLYRFDEHPALTDADQAKIELAFQNFKYWIDEPGLDAMCYFTENHQILFHVTQYLAGQRWPDRVFSNSGRSGREQQERARHRIEAWITHRLRGSFSEWDSNAYMTLDAFAMLALTEFAHSSHLRALATDLLDKLFFLIACQSFRGVHGSTHGRCYVAGLKSARFENTSGLQRLAWGMGGFNGETRALGMLAMADRYQVPEIIQSIGADLPEVLITRARSKGELRPQFDMKAGMWDVCTITRRTPDGMLSAAVDYRPGEMGIQEHLWQATLSPEAVIFTTYPGNSQEHGNARPNFWAGSARLPRVAMHDRTVICLYRLEAGVGLELTHAYFPAAMFDEYVVQGNWACARVGEGYVALWGDGKLALTETGRHVGQELRSRGAGQVWLCHCGRTADDGDFASFCHAVMQHSPQTDGLSVQWTTPTGHRLTFAWEGALKVDDQAVDWDDIPHYENRYTNTPLNAKTMTIRHEDQQIVLHLGREDVKA